MAEAKSVKKSLTIKQLKDRLVSGIHPESEVYIVGQNAFGLAVRVPVHGVRVTFGDDGKKDIVEIIAK